MVVVGLKVFIPGMNKSSFSLYIYFYPTQSILPHLEELYLIQIKDGTIRRTTKLHIASLLHKLLHVMIAG